MQKRCESSESSSTRCVDGSNVGATRVFSGIQPTGAKHLGNYGGGFRQYAATQESGETFCIVDLHSITVDHDPSDLRDRTLDLALLNDTDRVPIGDDQRQHLELARDIAGRFNFERIGFVRPERTHDAADRAASSISGCQLRAKSET